jgi:hypothetical protein
VERGSTSTWKGAEVDTRTTEVTFTNVTVQPPAELVFEECDQCTGHRHELVQIGHKPVANPPTYTQQHAGADHFGDRSGRLYRNSQFRGQEIRRTEWDRFDKDGAKLPALRTSLRPPR